MKVESPAHFPQINTHTSKSMHPHQSIFYDRQNVLDEDTDKDSAASKNEEFGLPEIYSMQMNKKIYNNRLSNDYDNLGSLVTGMQKDLNEISGMILGFEKYGTQVHNLRKDV